MRRPLLLMMTALLGAASIAVVMAFQSLAPASVSQASTDTGDIDVARRYYEAINHMIATGDIAPLHEVVSVGLIDLEPPSGGADGRSGIEQYLAFLHVAAPDARIEPTSLAEDRGKVTAHLTVRRDSASTMLGFVLDSALPLWPAVEELRVVSGQVLERRGSWDGMATLAPGNGFPYELDLPARRDLTASLCNYAPRTVGKFTTIDAPEILRLLTGEAIVTLSASATNPAFIQPPPTDGGTNQRHTISAGRTGVLAPGDVAVIPPGSAYTVTNLQGRPAAVMRVFASIPADPGSDPEAFSQSPQHGIFVQALARLQPADLGGPATVAIGTATLMPGARLVTTTETSLLIACSETGTLRCVRYESGREEDGMIRVYQFRDVADAANPMLLLARELGRDVLLNAGTVPATTWVISVSSV